MKKLLLPLSCLLALTACWRETRPTEPDWNPSRDIPAGTLVRVTLQDVTDPSRISTFVVDPRAGRVVDRKDGRLAQQKESQSMAAQEGLSTQTVSTAVQVPCPEIPDDKDDPGCLVNASDPKHETTGDPNPIMDYKTRLALTEKFVTQVAVKLLEAAHTTGVNVGVRGLKQTRQ
jgi:hypothetical protein